MERRAIRDRVALDREAGMRDVHLRGDLSKWLERRVGELEKNEDMRDSEDAALMRTVLRSSKRRRGTAQLMSGMYVDTVCMRRTTL
jgi:hypothetical protein